MHRTALGFPPAVRVIVLHVSGAIEPTVEHAAQAWGAALSRAAKATPEGEHLTILGPVRSPVPRVRGRYRRQILIKSRSDFNAVQTIRSTLADLELLYARRTVKVDVDVPKRNFLVEQPEAFPGVSVERRYLRPDGTVRWCRVAATAVRGADAVFIAVADIDWVVPDVQVAHPFDDGTAGVLPPEAAF